VDIGAWLPRSRAQAYESAFHDNDVDTEVLLELTADDLINIGVTSVVHRRKLLAAIAALGIEGPTALSRDAPSPARGRTPAADGDVLRSGRLDGTRRSPRSR